MSSMQPHEMSGKNLDMGHYLSANKMSVGHVASSRWFLICAASVKLFADMCLPKSQMDGYFPDSNLFWYTLMSFMLLKARMLSEA